MGRLSPGTKPRHRAENHSTLKQRAAAASIGASTILAAVKLAAGFASGSLALLSEGAHNTLDIGACAIGAILFSIVVDTLRWRALTHVARLTSSHALSADALHYSSDLIS